MKKMYNRFHNFWTEEKSLTALLIILAVHIFFIQPVADKNILAGKIIVYSFYFLLLVSGIQFLNSSRRQWIITTILIAGVCMLFYSELYETNVAIQLLADFFMIWYFALLAWVVLKRIFYKGPISVHRIQGSIVLYLLIGFLFSNIFHVLYLLYADAAFKGLGIGSKDEFLYFSFTTLTTVGYGDITPAMDYSRSMANMEALIGQLYPAILIARLVSMEVESKKRYPDKTE